MASLCDTCRDPGHCCRAFFLDLPFQIGVSRLEVTARMVELGLPFIPLRRDRVVDGQELWVFGCSALTPAGRCGIYAQRPEPCRLFEPKSDPICIEAPAHEARS